jgi:ABC-type nitrate/sulfonate/bicarbonate transport system substrate-binding protein
MKRVYGISAVLLGLLSSVLPAGAGQAPQTVNIATSAAGQSGYLAALIENKKLDLKYGIKLNNMMMDFTEAANAVKLGRTVASSMQPSTAVNLVKSGTEIRLITPQIWSGNSWVVRKDAPYKSFADLRGKKIGNFARVTGAYFFSAVIAKEQKLDIEKDFKNVPAETGALIALLERGEVEAINTACSPTSTSSWKISSARRRSNPPLACSRKRWKSSPPWSRRSAAPTSTPYS